MRDERYKQIMSDLGMPDSRSLLTALRQVANEAAQEWAAIQREACAKICRDIGDGDPEWTVTVGEACANEILALTTEQPRG